MNQTLANRWSLLDGRRSAVLLRAEEAARVTIPALFTREGHTESSNLPAPYQGLGARAVNTLASKINLALFPPSTRFFRLGVSSAVKAESDEKTLATFEEVLSEIESDLTDMFESSNARSVLPDFARQMLVTGNYLFEVDQDGEVTGYNLRSYCVDRDGRGRWIELLIREEVSPATLSDEVIQACEVKVNDKDPDADVVVYTGCFMEQGGKRYKYHQEINGKTVPGSEGTFAADKPRFIPLRMTAVAGESYGRGLVSEYQGDWNALDDLSRDLLKASANAAKIIWLRDPNGTLSPKKLAAAKSGDILDGRPADIAALTLDKYADFRVSLERIAALEDQLQRAFLMHSSVQRNAERVTAEEIRFMAQELESALGGVYSVLARELQVAYLGRLIEVGSRKKAIPKVPRSMVRMKITTGLEALGRGADLTNIRSAVGVTKELLGEQETLVRVNADSVLTKVAAAHGMKKDEFLNTEDQVKQIRQQNMAANMMQGAAPGVATEITKGMMQQ